MNSMSLSGEESEPDNHTVKLLSWRGDLLYKRRFEEGLEDSNSIFFNDYAA
ncbi:hypothetical protein VCHA55O506_10696 [Vibrio chagasii]|nr:hypothetical protein VCHA55O506_10696 [Vibrio chagasii]